MSSVEIKQDLFKIVVVGDGGVGKTTLLHRYVHGEYLRNASMTIGVEFFNKRMQVKNKEYRVIFWDVGGQKRFLALHDSYIGGSLGAICMFDMSRIQTLYHIEEWLNIVRRNCGDIPILLVGAKYDLILNFDEEVADAIKEEALWMKEEYELFDLIYTSSKIGYNIDNAFSLLLEKVSYQISIRDILSKFDKFKF